MSCTQKVAGFIPVWVHTIPSLGPYKRQQIDASLIWLFLLFPSFLSRSNKKKCPGGRWKKRESAPHPSTQKPHLESAAVSVNKNVFLLFTSWGPSPLPKWTTPTILNLPRQAVLNCQSSQSRHNLKASPLPQEGILCLLVINRAILVNFGVGFIHTNHVFKCMDCAQSWIKYLFASHWWGNE